MNELARWENRRNLSRLNLCACGRPLVEDFNPWICPRCADREARCRLVGNLMFIPFGVALFPAFFSGGHNLVAVGAAFIFGLAAIALGSVQTGLD